MIDFFDAASRIHSRRGAGRPPRCLASMPDACGRAVGRSRGGARLRIASVRAAAGGAAAALVLTAAPRDVHAAPTVTLYGIVDTDVAYVSDAGAGAATKMISGVMQASRWGLLGDEDLGGGYRAIFRIEAGFNPENGTMGQGTGSTSRLFGRQAYVGLDLPWATVTLGRQYDFMFELGRYSAGQFMGSYALRPATGLAFLGNNGSSPDFDRVGGARVDNAAKVVSKEVGHTVVGALVSFGGQPGSFSAGRTLSLGARYGANDFGIGAAYTTRRDDAAPASFEVYGAGASYRLARWTFQALYTHSKWALTGDKVAVYEVSARYQVNTPLFLSAGAASIVPNHGTANAILPGRRKQVEAGADYFLSKRTDVYLVVAYQRAAAGSVAAMYPVGSAGGRNQTAVNLGLRHTF